MVLTSKVASMCMRYFMFETLGYLLCELAFKTDCCGPFALAYRAGCWCYAKVDYFVP